MRRAIAILAVALVLGGPAAAAATPTAPAGPPVLIRSARAAGDAVQLVAQSTGTPGAAAPEAGVFAGGKLVPARTVPLLADDASLVLVVDTAGDPQALADGRSGLAGLLLQLSPELPTGVISDARPPVVQVPVAAGVSDDVGVLANLRGQPTRATADALALAVNGHPADGPPRTVVLWTGAPDAGGETQAALIQRLAAANAVLVVVTPEVPTSGYWQAVATRSGGFLTSPSPGEPAVRTFDRLGDQLRSSYVVTFDRPAASGRAELRWSPSGGTPVSLPFTLPVSAAAAGPRTAAAEDDAGSQAALVAGGLGLLLVVLGVVALALRRARHAPASTSPPAPRVAERLAPNGVRVFDLRDDRPREVDAADLFEPRAERDARERSEQARQRRDHDGEG